MSIFSRNSNPSSANPPNGAQNGRNSRAASNSRDNADNTVRLLDGAAASPTQRRTPSTGLSLPAAGGKRSLNFSSNFSSVVPSLPGPGTGPVTSNEVRKLIVGREIAMAGEITACDYLVVEGTLDAQLRDGQRIEINQTGLFRGAASVIDADIAGRFEGELSVSGRLRIRATGRVSGRIQYGELEIEAGGQVQGEMVTLAPSQAQGQADLNLRLGMPANASSPSGAEDETYRTGTAG